MYTEDKQTLFTDPQWQGKWQWAQIEMQKIPCEYQNLFYYELFAPWNRLPREATVTPSFEILTQNLTGHSPGQLALADCSE